MASTYGRGLWPGLRGVSVCGVLILGGDFGGELRSETKRYPEPGLAVMRFSLCVTITVTLKKRINVCECGVSTSR